MQDVILAVDIGGSKYMAGLVDGQGQVWTQPAIHGGT